MRAEGRITGNFNGICIAYWMGTKRIYQHLIFQEKET